MDEVILNRALQTAIEEAKKGLGRVHHNPPVGCVILSKNGDVIGKGYHEYFGGPHAEVNALRSVKDERLLKDATVVVTLEPCAHDGKTPSCAKKLAMLPLGRVIYGLRDPNPLVAGKGAEIVRAAGIETLEFPGDKVDQLEDLAEIFLWVHRKRSPFVALKAAISSNESIVTGSADRWISGEESRTHVHLLRSQFDAVLIGVGTFLEDDPRLNIRLGDEVRENFVVVLDPEGRGLSRLENSRLLKVRKPEKVIWVVGDSVSVSTGINILKMPVRNSYFDLQEVLGELFRRDIHSVFVEGGAHTFGSFLSAELVNRVYLYKAPLVVPESSVKNWHGDFSGTLSVEHETKENFGVDEFTSMRLRR